jgi:hypothetical protein
MVSSYLVCDVCGGFGPPAGFLSENGLRLCYQCWYQERYGDNPPVADSELDAVESAESVKPVESRLPFPGQSCNNS